MTEPLLAYPVLQYAFVVGDLDEGMRHWTRAMGAGPFFVIRDFLGNELTYRGAPSSTRVNYAFGQCGPVQIQLISQDDPGPSIYRDMFAPGECGLHHVCALVPMEDWDAQLERFTQAGFECASSLTTTVPAVYFDCREDLGHFVELYGRNERTEGFFAMVAETHENWDGHTHPVRTRDGSPEVGIPLNELGESRRLMQEPLIRYPIVQYAYVVEDLDAGIKHWIEVMGAGPFFVSRNHRGREHTYRGTLDEAVFSYAFGQAGPAQIQLIQCMDNSPSVYRDMFAPGVEGFHHVACLVPAADMPEEVARFVDAGYEVASTLHSYVPVAYLDCRSTLGFFVELHGLNEDVKELFTEIREAHHNWDGVTEPVRVRNKTSSK